MLRAEIRSAIDAPWTQLEPLRVGAIPCALGTPDYFVLVDLGDVPVLRVDLYMSSDECCAFTEAVIWADYLVIGCGDHLHLIELAARTVTAHNLGSYFGHLYPATNRLFAASAEQLFCFGRDGTMLWQSPTLAIDGVVVNKIADSCIDGEGEWDPPGGWRPFRLRLSDGAQM